jgi:flagellar biosynthesis protein FlhF
MYLRRFRSTNVRDALRAARQELGPDALVLSTELVTAGGWRGWLGTREVEITAATERDVTDDRLSRPGERHRSEGRRGDAASSEATARLRAAGIDTGFADEIVAAIPDRNRRGATLHSLRAALAGRLSTLAAPDEEFARVEVFVGPPGAGKTTTIAKIAAQEVARHGQRLGLVAADGFRIGAVEQLRMYAGIIGSPFRIARTGADLEQALRNPRTPVLVDTAGRSPTDDAARELFRVLANRRDVRTHLVMPADTPAASARRIFDLYAEANPSRLVLTKLDEAESLSPLVGLLRERHLLISYLGTGQRVPEDLNRATAQLLAASVLGETQPEAVAVSS